LRCVSALARQADAQDLYPAGQRQMPALLLLLPRCRLRADLSAGADMVPVPTLPIRLTHTPTTCRVRPVAGIKLSIGRCFYFASDAEQRAEGVERVEAPIEAKRKFVEVSL